MLTQTSKIMLLDFDPNERLGQSLKELCEPSETMPLVFSEPACQTSATPQSIRQMLGTANPDMVFMTFGSLPYLECQPALRSIREADARLPLLVAAREWDAPQLMEFLKQGMTDFITAPFRSLDIIPRIMRLMPPYRKQDAAGLTLKEKLGLKKLLGTSPAFLKEIEKIPMLARCDAGVLITGETGTGKEVCARAIHYLSSRSDQAFIAVNCGAIPPDLIENELFGHEREAFTGAACSKPGLVREADGGTLFLDEVDSLSPLAQVKLLRFLQEKEYRPLGSVKTVKADVRVLAASNLDLEKAAADGRLRRDLYYRLNVVSINLPALRERREDISLLLDFFLDKYAREYGSGPFHLAPEVAHALTEYPWPGNVRQLEHAAQRAVLMAAGPVLGIPDFTVLESSQRSDTSGAGASESFQASKARLVRDFEKNYIRSLLTLHNGNISHAARTAKKNRRAFWQLVQKHGIEVKQFRLS